MVIAYLQKEVRFGTGFGTGIENVQNSKKSKQAIANKLKSKQQQQQPKLKMSSINQSGTNVGIPRIFALSCFTHHLLLFCSRIVQKFY